MRAAICYRYDEPLIVEPVHLASPEQGAVKVRLLATAICQSNVHLIRGKVSGTLPPIAGHEGYGIVEEIGNNVAVEVAFV